jgi:hypothetical protein
MISKTIKTYTLNIDVVREFDKKTQGKNKSQLVENFMRKYNAEN